MENDLPVYGVKPPHVSPYLALPIRTPTDVLLSRLAPRPRWDIWAMPERIEPFHLEQTLTELTNERAALDCLANVADNFDCVVIYTDAEGNQSDVSDKFARDYAISMARDDWDEEALLRVRFLSCHLTNDEIYEICRSR